MRNDVGDSVLKGIGWMVVGALILGFVALLIGYPVKWLWNTTMPDLFGLKEIGFWEAFRLSWLCSILFKGTVKDSKG